MSILGIIILVIFSILLLWGICFGIYHFSRDIAQGIWGYGIPYIHTPEQKIAKILENLQLKKWEIFIDIWCGNGAILEAVKIQFPHAIVVGYEKSYRPYQDALKRKEQNWLEYEIIHGDFFNGTIKNATVLYSYMINYIMEKIWKKIANECRPWTLFFSSSFPLKVKEPKSVITLPDTGRIFIYEVEKKDKL